MASRIYIVYEDIKKPHLASHLSTSCLHCSMEVLGSYNYFMGAEQKKKYDQLHKCDQGYSLFRLS
jgi:hypothetical protein